MKKRVTLKKMDIKTWGPAAWTFLHAVTYRYPSNPTWQEKKDFSTFFDMVGKTLPCTDCGQHFQKAFQKANFDSRTTLEAWLVDVHNAVNKRLNKPVLTVEEARRSFTSPVITTRSNNLGLYIGLILASIGLYIFLNFKKTEQSRFNKTHG